jgi:SpoVK/Ycf46/Vps4 family AAA+-type ATPase
MFQGGLSEFLKNNGLTGNPAIDAILMANLVPLLIAYSNAALYFFKSTLSYICGLIWSYCVDYFKSKLIGTEVCVIEITKDNSVLFNVLKKKIFDSSVVSNVDDKTFHKLVSMIGEKSKFDYFNWTRERYENKRFKIKDFSYNDESVFEIYKNHEKIGSTEVKIFLYKNNYIKCEYDGTDNNLLIKVITFEKIDKNNIDEINYVKLVESFLSDKFNINDSIVYKSRVSIDNTNIYKLINTFSRKNMISSSTGHLNIGENLSNIAINIGTHDSSDDKTELLSKKNIMRINHDTLNDETIDYKKHIKLENIHENDTDMLFSEKLLSHQHLYKKYISDTLINNMSHYSFFIKNSDIILMTFVPGNLIKTIYFDILSKKPCKNKEFKETFNWLLQTILKKNKGLPNASIVQKERMHIMKLENKEWKSYLLDKRSFDNVFLPTDLMNDIVDEFKNFIKLEKLYREIQVPFRKGLLFHGPPGTGKTSLVKALSYEFQLPIYLININDDSINDDSIVSILNELGGGMKILLFEDIDSAFSQKEIVKIQSRIQYSNKHGNKYGNKHDNKHGNKHGNKHNIHNSNSSKSFKMKKGQDNSLFEMENDKPNENEESDDDISNYNHNNHNNSNQKCLTYSGLLNALDGVMSSHHGVITIMTTNYIEKLGPAFLRPGRIDRKFNLIECNKDQIERMVKSYVDKRLKIINDKDEQLKYTNEFIDVKISEMSSQIVDRNDQSWLKPCDMQSYIITNIIHVDDIFDNVRDLIKLKPLDILN